MIIADILRQTLAADVQGHPNIPAYIERACTSPAFKKACGGHGRLTSQRGG